MLPASPHLHPTPWRPLVSLWQGSRRISLRFLAWHLLGQQMSNRLQDTHDSIEDARTALQLYAKYREIVSLGTLDETIRQLYDVGRDTQWSVD